MEGLATDCAASCRTCAAKTHTGKNACGAPAESRRVTDDKRRSSVLPLANLQYTGENACGMIRLPNLNLADRLAPAGVWGAGRMGVSSFRINEKVV